MVRFITTLRRGLGGIDRDFFHDQPKLLRHKILSLIE
jgi:hypothetical protein